jgi:hypothetical protein
LLLVYAATTIADAPPAAAIFALAPAEEKGRLAGVRPVPYDSPAESAGW